MSNFRSISAQMSPSIYPLWLLNTHSLLVYSSPSDCLQALLYGHTPLHLIFLQFAQTFKIHSHYLHFEGIKNINLVHCLSDSHGNHASSPVSTLHQQLWHKNEANLSALTTSSTPALPFKSSPSQPSWACSLTQKHAWEQVWDFSQVIVLVTLTHCGSMFESKISVKLLSCLLPCSP